MPDLVSLGNIGPKEQRKRKILGYLGIAAAAVGGITVEHVADSRWWTLALFFPAWFGMLCLLQAYQKT